MENISTKCLIIGSGPAGYTAAIYASRANLSPILFEGMQPGGQLTTTSEIENFPGYPEGIGGFEMMDELRQQAERFGTDVRDGEITAVDFSKRPFTATTDDGTAIKADTVIIATGASAKYLGIDDEQRYAGRGVSACATCDGFFYRKKTVAVVGGGGIRRQGNDTANVEKFAAVELSAFRAQWLCDGISPGRPVGGVDKCDSCRRDADRRTVVLFWRH